MEPLVPQVLQALLEIQDLLVLLVLTVQQEPQVLLDLRVQLVLLVLLDRQVQIQQFLDLLEQRVQREQLVQQDLVLMRFQSHFY
jgi:hypothetical protein